MIKSRRTLRSKFVAVAGIGVSTGLLHTDGVTEVKVAGGRLGVDELTRLFAEIAPHSRSSRTVVDALFARLPLESFSDDVTRMAICNHRSSNQPAS